MPCLQEYTGAQEFPKVLVLLESKHTTDDMMFTVETVSCLGVCDLASACTVNDVVYSTVTPGKVYALIDQFKKEAAEVRV